MLPLKLCSSHPRQRKRKGSPKGPAQFCDQQLVRGYSWSQFSHVVICPLISVSVFLFAEEVRGHCMSHLKLLVISWSVRWLDLLLYCCDLWLLSFTTRSRPLYFILAVLICFMYYWLKDQFRKTNFLSNVV